MAETATLSYGYGVSVTALASWNGLGPDMAIRVNQELLIPIASGANRIPASTGTEPGQGTDVAPPPRAAAPLVRSLVLVAVPAARAHELRAPGLSTRLAQRVRHHVTSTGK